MNRSTHMRVFTAIALASTTLLAGCESTPSFTSPVAFSPIVHGPRPPEPVNPPAILNPNSSSPLWVYPRNGSTVWVWDPSLQRWYVVRRPADVGHNEQGDALGTPAGRSNSSGGTEADPQPDPLQVDPASLAAALAAGPQHPMPPNFTATAEALIAAANSNHLVGQHFTIQGSIVAYDLDETTLTGVIDARVPWSSNLTFPDFTRYPGLLYEVYEVDSLVPGNPGFVTVRVAGDAMQVTGYLIDMGATGITLPAGNPVSTITIDSAAARNVYFDGVHVGIAPPRP